MINLASLELTQNNENDVSRMICTLSDLLRISFKTKENLIPIEDELLHAKKYIDIQNLRYEDKFSVTWDIDKEVYKYYTAKLILQPIIENAIVHGINPSRKNGTISISTVTNESNIIFTVKDTGIGITPETLDKLGDMLITEDALVSDNIGLFNVNQRIKLIFGNEYGCTISSDYNGTTVTIVIPKLQNPI